MKNKQKNLAIIGFMICLLVIPIVSITFSETDNSYSSEDMRKPIHTENKKIKPSALNSPEIPIEVENFFTYISDYSFQNGKNYTSEGNTNSITDLKYIDGQKFEIEGEWSSFDNQYLLEVYFGFGADLNTYQLDYYDLFLFLEIDKTNVVGSNLELQAYKTYNWETVCEIGDSAISLSRHYLERTTQFRIVGSTTSIQGNMIVKIEQLNLVIGHDGNIGPLELKDCISSVEVLSKSSYDTWRYDDGWWTENNDNKQIYLDKSDTAEHANTYIYFDLRMFIDKPDTGGTINDMNKAEFIARFAYQTYTWHPSGSIVSTEGGYHDTFIKKNNNWDAIYSGFFRRNYLFYKELSWSQVGNSIDNYIKYDQSKNAYYFDLSFTTASAIIANPYGIAESIQLVDEIDCTLKFDGYGFENHDYPKFVEVKRPTDFNFEINTIGSYSSSSITSVEYLVQNDTYYSGWQPITQSGDKWDLRINKYDYENGKYNVWIRATDEHGFSTYDSYSLDIINRDSPLCLEGPIDGETIIFNCTTPETSNAIFNVYLYCDHTFFDEEIKLYIDNGIDGRQDRTPPGGLVNGSNSVNLEPYGQQINGNVTVIIEATDIFGIMQSDSRDFIFRKMINATEIEYERGVEFIGNQLYAIIYDPNGDRSWASYTLTSSYSSLYEFDIKDTGGIEYKFETVFNTGGHFSFKVGYDDYKIRIFTQTIDTNAITSTTTWDARTSSTGPGRGDTYWGQALYLPYYTKATKAEFWGAEGHYEYIDPTICFSLNFTGEIIGGPNEVPSEWLEENYIIQAEQNGGIFPETADISWSDPSDSGLGIRTVYGGGRDLDHTHSDKELTFVNEKTLTFDVDAGVKLGLVEISIGIGFKLHWKDEGTETTTRRYHMEDFDYYDDVGQGDVITNRIGIDNRFGTYIFETIEEACFTSDPWEYNTNDWRSPILNYPEIELDSNNDGVEAGSNDEPLVTIEIEDESGVQSAVVMYSIDGVVWNTSPLTEYSATPGKWWAHIRSFPVGTTVLWYVEVTDLFENIAERKMDDGSPFSYTVVNSAPMVILLSPEENGIYNHRVPIEWIAFDIDNDDLTINLYYMDDEFWIPIALDVSGTSYVWRVRRISADYVRVKVEVSDGQYIAEDYIINSIKINDRNGS